jgi:hypothetical protein
VDLVVPGDSPHAKRSGETTQDRKHFIRGLFVPFEDIAKQNHQVGLLCLNLGDPRLQPPLPEYRAEVQV